MPEIWEKYLHKAQFISTSTLFSAVFNAVVPGRYDFDGTTAAQNVPVIALDLDILFYSAIIIVAEDDPFVGYIGGRRRHFGCQP